MASPLDRKLAAAAAAASPATAAIAAPASAKEMDASHPLAVPIFEPSETLKSTDPATFKADLVKLRAQSDLLQAKETKALAAVNAFLLGALIAAIVGGPVGLVVALVLVIAALVPASIALYYNISARTFTKQAIELVEEFEESYHTYMEDCVKQLASKSKAFRDYASDPKNMEALKNALLTDTLLPSRQALKVEEREAEFNLINNYLSGVKAQLREYREKINETEKAIKEIGTEEGYQEALVKILKDHETVFTEADDALSQLKSPNQSSPAVNLEDIRAKKKALDALVKNFSDELKLVKFGKRSALDIVPFVKNSAYDRAVKLQEDITKELSNPAEAGRTSIFASCCLMNSSVAGQRTEQERGQKELG